MRIYRCLFLGGAVLSVALLVQSVATSIAGPTLATVDESAAVFGTQSATCGQSGICTNTAFCTGRTRADLCTFLGGAACGTGLCPYDCTAWYWVCPPGLLTVADTPAPCPPAATSLCTPGWIYGCNCSGAAPPVACQPAGYWTAVNCAVGS